MRLNTTRNTKNTHSQRTNERTNRKTQNSVWNVDHMHAAVSKLKYVDVLPSFECFFFFLPFFGSFIH